MLKLVGLFEELGYWVEYVDYLLVLVSFVDDFVFYWGFLVLV